MTACIASVVNMKGGVGKSTVVNALAHCLAHVHFDVLVVDLDPQASVSAMQCGPERWHGLWRDRVVLEEYFQQFVHGGEARRFSDFIVAADNDLADGARRDLVAAGPELRHLDRDCLSQFILHGLDQAHLRQRIGGVFGAAIRSIADRYDLILLDFPPGVSCLTDVAAAMSDLLVVPTIPDRPSVGTLKSVTRRARDVWADGSGRVQRLHVLVNKFDENSSSHCDELAILRQEEHTMRTVLPFHEHIVRAGTWSPANSGFNEKFGDAAAVVGELASEVRELTAGS